MATVLGQDPLSQPATVLPTGPGALDIGFKRMGMEQEAGKIAAAKKIAADEIIEKKKKDWDITPETADIVYTQPYLEKHKELVNMYSNLSRAYNEGTGSDPREPGSEANRQMNIAVAGLKQYVANTKEIGKQREDDRTRIKTSPHLFTKPDGSPVSEADLITSYGEISPEDPHLKDVLSPYYQLDKYLDSLYAKVDPSIYQKAYLTGDGTARSVQDKAIAKKQLLDLAQQAVGDTYAADAALTEYENMAKRDPSAAAEVAKIAKEEGVPMEVATIYHRQLAKYGSTQHTETQSAGAGAGYGTEIRKQAPSEYIEVWRGITDGRARGMTLGQMYPQGTSGGLAVWRSQNPELYKAIFEGGVWGDPTKLKDDIELVGDLNDRVVMDYDDAGAPRKIRTIVRNQKSGKYAIWSATDEEMVTGNGVMSPVMNKDELISKGAIQGVQNTPNIGFGTQEAVNYINRAATPVEQSGGNLPLDKSAPFTPGGGANKTPGPWRPGMGTGN